MNRIILSLILLSIALIGVGCVCAADADNVTDSVSSDVDDVIDLTDDIAVDDGDAEIDDDAQDQVPAVPVVPLPVHPVPINWTINPCPYDHLPTGYPVAINWTDNEIPAVHDGLLPPVKPLTLRPIPINFTWNEVPSVPVCPLPAICTDSGYGPCGKCPAFDHTVPAIKMVSSHKHDPQPQQLQVQFNLIKNTFLIKKFHVIHVIHQKIHMSHMLGMKRTLVPVNLD